MTDPGAQSVLLVAGGTTPTAEILLDLVRRHSTIVAADAGALSLIAAGIEPHITIGDFDSVDGAGASEKLSEHRVLRIPSQDRNDLEKSLEWIADNDYRDVTVVGVSGGLFDHAINNLSVLARWATRLALRMVDDRSIGWFVVDRQAFETFKDDRVSLIPLPEARLTTSGLQWDLRNEWLKLAIREGASNRATGPRVDLTVHEGCALAFHYPRSR